MLNINNHDVVLLTEKLEKIHRSAVPVAVRQSLDKAAYEMVGGGEIKRSFFKRFTIRRPTFIKSHIAYNKSPNTFDIKKMVSSAGLRKGKSRAGDQLVKQEFGGTIANKAIPRRFVRTGADIKKKIRAAYYYRKFRNAKKGHVSRNRNRTIIKTDTSILE